MRNEPLPQSARVPIQLLSVNRSARFLFARAMKGLGPFAFPPSSLERIEMRATKRWVTAVDDWRRHQPDRPSRGEAIRRLVEQSLVASKPARRPDQNARAAAASTPNTRRARRSIGPKSTRANPRRSKPSARNA